VCFDLELRFRRGRSILTKLGRHAFSTSGSRAFAETLRPLFPRSLMLEPSEDDASAAPAAPLAILRKNFLREYDNLFIFRNFN
jgi:hypothetical protein